MTHFPDHPHDGETVAEEIGPDQARIWTYNEAKNEWTYKDYGPGGQLVFTDQVLVRDNQEVPGLKLDDPSTLMTQKEVNYWLDEKAGQGGGGGTIGKESKPWLQINRWTVEFKDRTAWATGVVYQPWWDCNSNCTYTWQYEIDINGDGDWIDVANHPQKEELGYTAGGEFPDGEMSSNLILLTKNALMRFRITGELNGVLSECLDSFSGKNGWMNTINSILSEHQGTSSLTRPWEDRSDVYDPPLYEDGTAVDLDPYATTDYVDEKVGEYLPLSGGTVTGDVVIDQASGTAFRVKKNGVDKFKVEHSGKVFCNYNMSLDDDPTTVPNKGWVKEQIAAIPEPEVPEGGGGVGFTEKYNGNRFYKAGLSTDGLSEGEVMFLQGGVTTTMLAAVTHVALPEAGIDWTKFTNIGTIEVRNGGTLCGHLQVVSAKNNSGRNWLVKVKALDIVSNEIEPDSGHPCYFWGMFTE